MRISPMCRVRTSSPSMYLPFSPLRFLEGQGLGESTLAIDACAAARLKGIEVQFDKQPAEDRFIPSDQVISVKFGIPALAVRFGWLPDAPELKTFNGWIRNCCHHPSDDGSSSLIGCQLRILIEYC